jgi:glutamate 5-kinase
MIMQKILKELHDSHRIVVKVGTSTLTYDTGKLNLNRIECLVRVLADLRNQGKQVVLVTSGAIGVGVGKLGLRERPDTIPGKQAAAAIGQCQLMHLYDKLFSEYGQTVAQILLTKDVVENDHRKDNAVNTFNTLLEYGVVPIVNENDTIAIEEIEYADNFGDNDTLSAVVAELIKADLLVILSDIDGLYNEDPKKNPEAKIIHVVEKITDTIKELAGGAGSSRGTGGMATKITAAEIACSAGVNMVITSGEDPRILYDIMQAKQVGTLFMRKR